MSIRPSALVSMTAAWAALTVLTGCSEAAETAAPKLPERTCFGVFSRSDLGPLVGKGEEVKESGPADMQLTALRRTSTCSVDVDGRSRFLASATRQPLEQSFFWNAQLIKPPADPLPLGDKGIVYDTGARVLLVCKGSGEPFQVELAISGSIDQVEKGGSRPLFTQLMKKFVEAGRQQTKCGI
ncbi:hypothetical protein CP980_20920 [Streptomyces vinaceus]|uniref:DUF3558 domain-containing protein n=1 Tax=Streptomyces vinaceus TaxID=1960 RepID=A0A5J6J8K5_STRVI|nr:hypothetical protein [Streptomyces vinaceus]QEV47219.1 hypothetical protein CP980_20920 [Streptomyces vinaceus]GHE40210.1 hypothetical protein GCM10017778_24390 [Streptomyces vinaceus]